MGDIMPEAESASEKYCQIRSHASNTQKHRSLSLHLVSKPDATSEFRNFYYIFDLQTLSSVS